MNISDKLLSRGEAAAPAVFHEDEVITYGELRRRTRRTAGALLDRGHTQGDRIGILAENSPFFVVAYLGIIQAGLVAVPLGTDLPAETQLRMAREAGMSRLLVSARCAPRSRLWAEPAGIRLLTEDELEAARISQPQLWPVIEPKRDLAALMFTSGSTGTPKAVMISHRNIECNAEDIIDYLGLRTDDRGMVVLPFHYCFGLSLLHTHLLAGASLVLSQAFKLFPEQVIGELLERDCTGFAGVPSTYQILLRRTRFCQTAFPRLRWLQQAGGKLPNPCIRELIEAFPQLKFFLMYGQTEATARLSFLPPERLRDKLGSLGRGLRSTRLEVLKANGSPVRPGSMEIGEIVAAGDNISPGYWNEPEETARFFRHGKLRTGDLARVDEDGFIFFVERERDFLKPGGNRVSAREIEDIIAELREVMEVAVVGAPHELLGEAIVACVVVRPDGACAGEDIERHCRKRLPAFKVPHQIRLLNSLPHNASGKVQKDRLQSLAGAPWPEIHQPAQAPAATADL